LGTGDDISTEPGCDGKRDDRKRGKRRNRDGKTMDGVREKKEQKLRLQKENKIEKKKRTHITKGPCRYSSEK